MHERTKPNQTKPNQTNIYCRCTVAERSKSADMSKSRFSIFHGDVDIHADQVDEIIGCMQDAGLTLTSYVSQGCGHGDLPFCMTSQPELRCYYEAFQDYMLGGH
jgi:hypothetical protein